MIYGYARVSSKEQNLSRQVEALKNYTQIIYQDKESGKDFERKEYKKLMRRLKSGDVLIIKSIDRLGRNYDGIIEEWRKITKEIGANIKVIDMPLLDTTQSNELIGKFVSDIVLQILSFVAENERTNIRQRQAEGIRIAKAKGVKFGRPAEDKTYLDDLIQQKLDGKIQYWDNVIELSGLSRETVFRRLRELKK